ncbi:hypothetical protein ACP275_02G097900 [Erythranthe tilingii]
MMMMMIKEVMECSQKEEGLSDTTNKKCCSDCKTTKTPLWRSGPSGPKSLCNACGIKHRKRRPTPATAVEGAWKNEVKKGKIGKTRKMKEEMIKPLGKEVEKENLKKKKKSSRRQWGEVEKAALLLMALSCGAVFD